jgi:hypothetical protein
LKLGNNPRLRQQMSIESRRMADEATWDSIGNKVAWKLAEALETRKDPAPTIQNSKVPVYSWVLLSSKLRNYVASWVVDARLLGGIGIIVGVWGGLAVTWGLVKVSLAARTPLPRVKKILGMK